MTRGGALVSGTLEAATALAAVRLLRQKGLHPLSTEIATTFRPLEKLANLRSSQAARPRALARLSQELATLLGAGVELDRALEILLKLDDLGGLRKPLAAIRDRVRSGKSLSEAIGAEPVFPKMYSSIIRAGERSGTLHESLKHLADYLTRTASIRETILSALVYPTILLATASLAILFILLFVLPQFEPLFAEAGSSLPWPTRLVMSIAHAIRDFWWLVFLACAAFVTWFRNALKSEKFRRHCEAYILRTPVIGRLMRGIAFERFCRTLATLIANGVALPAALGFTGETLSSAIMSDAVRETARKLREGERLADRLARFEIFPPSSLDLIRVGEETGKLPEMLARQADLDEQRNRHLIDRLLTMLVPALTIIVGLVVAALIGTMLTAILSVNDLALQEG